MFFDSHAHLDDKQFDTDREDMIKSLRDYRVTRVINPGSNMVSSLKAVELAQDYEFIYAAVGIHPHDAISMKHSDIHKLEQLAENPKVVAIGEIGLDYYYSHSPKDIQKSSFIEQLKLAIDINMPVIIHTRDAFADMEKILNKIGLPKAGGVMHCYSGSWEMAKSYMAMNLHISIAGVVTFKNAKKVVEVVKNMPFDRMLIETDSPYLTPIPFRGKRNFPGYINYAAEMIAEIKGVTLKEVAKITEQNTEILFKI